MTGVRKDLYYNTTTEDGDRRQSTKFKKGTNVYQDSLASLKSWEHFPQEPLMLRSRRLLGVIHCQSVTKSYAGIALVIDH